jgi:acetolactate synthase-1/2/3 large subunit
MPQQAMNAHQGVEHIFGYPGGAVLPIYDALFQQNARCAHPGPPRAGRRHMRPKAMRAPPASRRVLVTSGPGATNAVTGLTDALMDSIPMVVHHRPGAHAPDRHDAFQECDTVGITRACTKHNYLVKDVERPAAHHPRGVLHRHHRPPRPGRDRHSPRTCSSPRAPMSGPSTSSTAPTAAHRGRPAAHRAGAVEMMAGAKRPVFYTGGGVINSGPRGSEAAARAGAKLTGFPDHLDPDGPGRLPAADPQWLGMLGMHGTYEANLAMHDCDVMINIGARFDDRITGRSMPSRRARRRSMSTSIRPRSTRTCASTSASSAIAPRAGGPDRGLEGDLAARRADDGGAGRRLVGADRRLARPQAFAYRKPSTT